MKKTIHFSKFFTGAVVLSALVIISGIASIVLRGVNFGLDFKPGMIEEIRIAPAVMEVTYTGSATVSVDPSATGLDLVVSGVGDENRTVSVPYAEYTTVAAVAEQLKTVERVSVSVLKDGVLGENVLYVNSASTTNLSENPLRLFAPDAASVVNADEVRAALQDFESVDVKTLGTGVSTSYQIRMGVSKDETGKNMQEATALALSDAFGADKVAVVKSDFIGSQFSKNLVRDSILLVLATLLLIWIYATIRFHWDFALASVIAVVHDSLVMIAFIAFTRVEFSTTTIAAILTIVGYSINATVVILDRVRSDMKIVKTANFKDILDLALSETFSRSVITTVTTLFSVVALFVFTTGTIHDFAQVLIIGLISGCYSSIFISGAFIAATRKNFKNEGAVSVKSSNVVSFN